MNPPASPPRPAAASRELPRFETRRRITIVQLPADGIVKPADVEHACTIIEQKIEEAPPAHDFLLSFKDVQYMSSLFIGRLMGFYKKLAAKQSRLMLCDMHDQLVTVIRLARLEKQMPIYPDRAQALTGRTPAVTGIITATGIAALAGIGMLIKLVIAGGATPLRILATIILLANLPLPVLAWVNRRKISSHLPARQWAAMAIAIVLMLVALVLAVV